MKKKKDILKEVEEVKLSYRQRLSKSGEYLNFTIEINKPLIDIIKKATIKETKKDVLHLGYKDNSTEPITFDFDRFKVKSVIYSKISYTSHRDLIFNCDLLNKGKISFKVYSIDRIEDIKKGLRETARILIKSILNTELEQTLTFKLNLEQKENDE